MSSEQIAVEQPRRQAWLSREPELWTKSASEISTEQASGEEFKRIIFWPPHEFGEVKPGSTGQASAGQAPKPLWIKAASEIATEQASGTEAYRNVAWRPHWFWKESASDIVSGQASEGAQQTYK